jgi:hypothetical protein
MPALIPSPLRIGPASVNSLRGAVFPTSCERDECDADVRMEDSLL